MLIKAWRLFFARLAGRTKSLSIELPPQTKSRPRFTGNGHAYKDAKYRSWMNDAIAQLSTQWHEDPIDRTKLIVIDMFGNNARLDADNAAGAVLDVLVQANILTKDNVKAIPRLAISWQRERQGERIEIAIHY